MTQNEIEKLAKDTVEAFNKAKKDFPIERHDYVLQHMLEQLIKAIHGPCVNWDEPAMGGLKEW